VQPEAVSIAVSELIPDGKEIGEATRFYAELHEACVAVQHIIYSPADIARLFALVRDGVIAGSSPALLCVLGRYALNQESSPADLDPFLAALTIADPDRLSPFMVCAFGQSETASLVAAHDHGGHCRIGFENNLLMADGRMATNNAERIGELAHALGDVFTTKADRAQTLAVLGRP